MKFVKYPWLSRCFINVVLFSMPSFDRTSCSLWGLTPEIVALSCHRLSYYRPFIDLCSRPEDMIPEQPSSHQKVKSSCIQDCLSPSHIERGEEVQLDVAVKWDLGPKARNKPTSEQTATQAIPCKSKQIPPTELNLQPAAAIHDSSDTCDIKETKPIYVRERRDGHRSKTQHRLWLKRKAWPYRARFSATQIL